jgi:hypothetical protein
MKALSVPLGLGYALFGLVQITATASGIQHLTGLWWLVSWFIALFIGWMPVVGTALGVYGAHADWGWSLLPSFALFLGLPVLFIGIYAIFATGGALAERLRRA